METGFLLEKGHYNSMSAQQWVAGVPDEKAFFGMSTRGKVTYQVQTYRCTACGYLESYAK